MIFLKHIFIINPAAGAYDATEELKRQIESLNEKIDYEIYRTAKSGDATRYIKSVLETEKGKVRFYACGGDGTLNEVVNGAVLHDNASVSVYPCGSGNDFIKCFGKKEDFFDLNSLINAEERAIDVIKVGDKYAVNAVHFGFDTHALKTMLKVRRKKIIGGKRAYLTGVITALISGMKTKCTMKVDGKQFGKDVMLLCTIANGKYVGGMFKCAPKSDVSDGLFEACYVYPVSRFTFIRLVKAYVDGTYLDDPRFKGRLCYTRGKKVEVDIPDGYISIDGELTKTTHFTAEVVKGALNFAVPVAVKADIKEEEQVVC